MRRQYRVPNLRHHGIVVADDAGEDGPAAAQARDEVVAHFVLDAAVAHPLLGKLRAAAKLAQGLRKFAQRLDTSTVTAAILACGPIAAECSYSTPARTLSNSPPADHSA